MNLFEKFHSLHRVWRYRLRSERVEIRHLLSLDLAGTTIIDVGAHRGAYTYWMIRKAGMQGKVIAFEPQTELFAYLEEMADAFHWNNVDLEPLALSSREGTALLTRSRHWGGASLEAVADEGLLEQFEVPLATLDGYLSGRPNLPPVGFIKIDVQDHELSVLQGAVRTLGINHPVVLFECVDHLFREGKIHALLDSLGYSGFFFYRRKLITIDRLAELRKEISAPYLNYVYHKRTSASLISTTHG
ncbi:MAG: FkbM family methyltransferase [Verrucomicrobiales bacterium]